MINPNLKQFTQILRNAFIPLIIVITFISCEEDPDKFGNDFIEPLDSIGLVTDTSFTLKTYLTREDSINTSRAKYALMGRTNEPYYGKASAGFFTQLAFSNIMGFGENPVADSVFLYLKVNKYYDQNMHADVDVYQLNKTLYPLETYYSNVDPEEYYYPDKISQRTSYTKDTIKIRLSRAYGDLLMANDTSAIPPDNDSLFYENVPGLYCTLSEIDNRGYYAQVDLLNFFSKLTVWYHNNSTDEGESVRYDFPIQEEQMRFNSYQYDYSELQPGEENIRTYTESSDTATTDSLLFIQSPAGTTAKLALPEGLIEAYSNSDSLLIANAELILPVVDELNSFKNSEDLFFYNYAMDTSEISYGNSKYFEDENYFKVNVTNFVHNYVTGKYDRYIYLQVKNHTYQPGRVTFTGSGHSNPPKLKVKYYKP